jgi:hypothetical protein
VNKLVLLVIGAAWAAVLLPPLLRSRLEGRSGSSIMSFRRQLSTLQRTMPGGGIQMRQMARPLAGPQQHGPGARTHGAVSSGRDTVVSLDRRPIDSRSHHGDQRYGDQRYADPRNADPRMARQRQNASMARAAVKQRRQNILFMLAGSTAVTGLLWMMTKSASVAYAFVLSLCLFAGYVYLLAQSRKVDVPRVSR